MAGERSEKIKLKANSCAFSILLLINRTPGFFFPAKMQPQSYYWPFPHPSIVYKITAKKQQLHKPHSFSNRKNACVQKNNVRCLYLRKIGLFNKPASLLIIDARASGSRRLPLRITNCMQKTQQSLLLAFKWVIWQLNPEHRKWTPKKNKNVFSTMVMGPFKT